MKITTATLIAMLALGSSITFAQNGNPVPVKVASAETHTITINTVMRPLVAKTEARNESDEFHVNRSAALSATLQSRIGARQLQALPLQNGNVLNVLTAR